MKLYKEGYELKEDEYLLKIRVESERVNTGYLAKFNQNGSMPAAFKSLLALSLLACGDKYGISYIYQLML